MRSEYKNFSLNLLYQILTFIFPLITVPYISRVLGVEEIGIYSYSNSIAYMFMLFGMLGINNYGNREVAKVRDSKGQLDSTFSSIYSLQITFNFVVVILYFIYIFVFGSKFKSILLIQAILVFSNLFDVNWFYWGLERFKITISRNVIIKVLSLVLLFLFVKEKKDLGLYALIIAGTTFLSQLYLFFNIPHFVTFKFVGWRYYKKHISSVVLLFIPVLAYSIYRVMDKTMLGSMSSVIELGFYENAEKIINIPIAVNMALGTVMLPRMAYILENKKEEYKGTIKSSMKLAIKIATILGVGIFVTSEDISLVMFGPEFIKSGVIMRALSITIFFSAWANVIRTQLIIPYSKDKIYVKSTLGGAVLNLCANILLIKRYGAMGVCVGTVIAEAFVMFYQSFCCRKELELMAYIKILLCSLCKSILILTAACLICNKISNAYFRLISEILVSGVLFFATESRYIVTEFLGKQ